MLLPASAALLLLLGAEISLPAGGSLPEALARLAPGDTLRLSAGEHRGALGKLAGVTVVGAGAGVTVLLVPQGEDGVVAEGALSLSGLSIVTGPSRAALKVLGGAARLSDVALVGGASGAFVDTGSLVGEEVLLDGEYGLLSAHGEVRLVGLTASGRHAGLAILGGTLTVERGALTGPSTEAALVVAGGAARVAGLVVRAPGPAGVTVSGGTLTGTDLTVSGPREAGRILGDCLLVRRAEVRLSASELTSCGGAAVEASRAAVWLDGVDAGGGGAGCLIFTDQSRAELSATLCTGHGPGLVVMEGSSVRGFGARFWTDPSIWADCGSGARVELLDDRTGRQPCASTPSKTP
jgi:hypothetical protein